MLLLMLEKEKNMQLLLLRSGRIENQLKKLKMASLIEISLEIVIYPIFVFFVKIDFQCFNAHMLLLMPQLVNCCHFCDVSLKWCL